MSIVDVIFSYLPARRKTTPSGWTKFNAICCQHQGSTADRRQRAGVIQTADSISYHCFNCQFKASYVSGRQLTKKMRQLLAWLGVPDDVISKLSLQALKQQQNQEHVKIISAPVFENRSLPQSAAAVREWLYGDDLPAVSEEIAQVIKYLQDRSLDPLADSFYWSPAQGFQDRVIVPFLYQQRIVGWTARKLCDGTPKYVSEQTPGYVFNLDAQNLMPWETQRKFVIVVEGPMDALSVDGVAILGADITDQQSRLINGLARTVVLVPDRDKDGARTAEQALDLGWSVSLPQWHNCKDSNDAVKRYGRLATVASIIKHQESSALKTKLGLRSWLQGI